MKKKQLIIVLNTPIENPQYRWEKDQTVLGFPDMLCPKPNDC